MNNCSALEGIKLRMFLEFGPRRRMMDLLNGWKFKSLKDFACTIFPVGSPSVEWRLRNHYFCDCIDYNFVRFFRTLPQLFNTDASPIDLTRQIFCGSFPNQKDLYRRLNSFHLIKMVCIDDVGDGCPMGCLSIDRPDNATYHVICSSSISSLPLELPHPRWTSSRYKVEFSGMSLFRLEPRPYFLNTSILDASDNNLKEISDDVWKAAADIDTVFLHGNLPTTLPRPAAPKQHFRRMSMTKLSLYNNTWSCSCANYWLKSYLASIREVLLRPDEILCSSPS